MQVKWTFFNFDLLGSFDFATIYHPQQSNWFYFLQFNQLSKIKLRNTFQVFMHMNKISLRLHFLNPQFDFPILRLMNDKNLPIIF